MTRFALWIDSGEPFLIVGIALVFCVLLADLWVGFFLTQRPVKSAEERRGQLVSAAAFYPVMAAVGIGYALWGYPKPFTVLGAAAFYGAHAVLALAVFVTVSRREHRSRSVVR